MMLLDGRPVTAAELGPLALYGYANFTTMRVEDMAVRGLPLHLDRLVHDCRALMDAEPDRVAVRRAVHGAASALPSPVTVRVTVFDRAFDLGRPGAAAEPAVLVSARPAGPAEPPPLSLMSVEYERDLPEVKGAGLLGPLRHRRAAQAAGFDDALFHDRRSLVTEGATWNFAVIKDGEVLWPNAPHLAGTTMRLVSYAAGTNAYTSRSAAMRRSDLSGVEAAFVTNAAIGVRPVSGIDGRVLPGRTPLIDDLAQAYRSLPGDPL